MDVILAVLLIGGFSVVAIVMAWSYQRGLVKKMKGLASELGMEFTTGAGRADAPSIPEGISSLIGPFMPWRIEGVKDGFKVDIHTESRGTGKSRTTYTVVTMGVAGLPEGLVMKREGLLAKAGKAVFGTQDIESGDEEFDRKVIVKCKQPDSAKALISASALRRAMVSGIDAYPSLCVEKGAVTFARSGVIRDAGFYRDLIGKMGEIAREAGRA